MSYRAKATASVGQRILENMAFIGEVFHGYSSEELPDVPFLELARSFELDDKEE